MTAYKVTLHFTNLDNSLYTDDRANMSIDISADSYHHAYLLARRFAQILEADTFDIEPK